MGGLSWTLCGCGYTCAELRRNKCDAYSEGPTALLVESEAPYPKFGFLYRQYLKLRTTVLARTSGHLQLWYARHRLGRMWECRGVCVCVCVCVCIGRWKNVRVSRWRETVSVPSRVTPSRMGWQVLVRPSRRKGGPTSKHVKILERTRIWSFVPTGPETKIDCSENWM
jgi:hypothetical protein